MKFTKYFMAAALAVLALGCNKEQVAVEGTPDGQEVSVTFTAGLPGAPATKAIGDGTTAKNLVVAVYENDAEKSELASLRKTATFTDLKTTVNFSLVKGKTYHFIFWAQSYDVNAQNGPYDITDLKNIGIKYDGGANDEARDAFFAVRKDVKITGALTETIELKRPFAQVNFGTADFEAAKYAGVEPKTSVVEATDVATIFDPFAGEGKNPTTATVPTAFTAAALPTDPETITVENVAYKYLAMNYIIPTGSIDEKHVTNLTATFTDAAGQNVEVSVPSAPVQANWRTNIVGNLLTDQVVFNVEIKPAFEDDENIDLQNISTLSALKALFANGGSAVLTDNIEIKEALVLAGDKEVVLDLNGKSIINKSQVVRGGGYYTEVFKVGGKSHLVINGDGEVKALAEDVDDDGYRIAVWAYDEAVVDINGGSFYNKQRNPATANLIYAMGKATINIAGGRFETGNLAADGTSLMLNLRDSDRATAKIVVSGGEFVAFDPADNNSEGAHTNFCAPGYKTKELTSGVWTVVEASVIYTKEEFVAAATANVENIVIKLQNDIEFNDGARYNFWEIGGADTKTVTIEGTGNELLTYANDYRSQVKTVNPNAKLILKNLKMTSTVTPSPWDVYDIVFCTPVEIENVTFNKAIGFGASAYMKNVVVDESSNTTTASYAIWITPEKEMTITMDNCEIRNTAFSDGRAIKIDEQYVSNPQKVTLTVNGGKFAASSSSKALINVKNKGGNVITTTGNIDITGIPSGKMVATDIAGTVTYNGVQM